ncbi:DUF1109 domain-containing protein [Luteimonas salinilitoris]|uniref:DUF1109 domain-containing protein n=1 Tax=Luteimonas salinilitoris TaxID=3237697 RepID=A0ABV4HLR4_9GAMM
MTDTSRLIDQLTAQARPVRPLASPLRRTLLWVAMATALIMAIVAAYGLRPGLTADLAAPPALVEWIASILTGVLAAYAVFQISVPGRSPRWAWLPLPALALWLGGLGWGCLHDAARMGSEAFVLEMASSECAVAIAMASIPLGLVMLLMVRHAGVVRPGPTAMLSALSAAALSAAGVSLFHGGESALMVLLWHVGAVVVLSLLCLAFGRPLFSWIGYVKR